MLIVLSDPLAQAQQSLKVEAHENALPDAPVPVQDGSQTSLIDARQSSTGNISGTVFDSNGHVVPGAQVALLNSAGSVVQSRISGSNGQFQFADLTQGSYRLKVSGPDMTVFTSEQIALRAGEFRIAPSITLVVSGGETSVVVSGDKEELSREQVHIAVQQRVIGVIPNFYSAYDWNAPPMLAKTEGSAECPRTH